MSKQTALTKELELVDLRTLEEHPLVQPLYTEYRQLMERLRTLEPEIRTARASFHAAESHDPSVAFPVRTAREARQRIQELDEDLEGTRADLARSFELLEAAKIAARAEIRPLLLQEALEVLQQAETAMEALLQIQSTMQALERHAGRIGVGVGLQTHIDPMLPQRLQGIKRAITTRQR